MLASSYTHLAGVMNWERKSRNRWLLLLPLLPQLHGGFSHYRCHSPLFFPVVYISFSSTAASRSRPFLAFSSFFPRASTHLLSSSRLLGMRAHTPVCSCKFLAPALLADVTASFLFSPPPRVRAISRARRFSRERLLVCMA